MRVLLVDHDSEGLETIARAIRGVLELDCVTSKSDALLLLRQNTYDVLIACERAVDGSGLDLLGRTTRTTVPLKRIFAAAPERLQLLGPRLAPFKVQRTINYPIDLEELWLAIAQVTGGPNDETDGTIERVVLDERGIPAKGTGPRAPIPPRPPAPLGGLRSVSPPPLALAPAIAVAGSGARAAAARMVQPAPEPPVRAPPRPRAAPMRTTAPAMKSIPPMPMSPRAQPSHTELPGWTAVEGPGEDEFAQVAAQARSGVQRKVVDEVTRRKRQRLLTAGGIAVAVAATLVFLIGKFYDPEGWARDKAIKEQVAQMVEQQKVTDDLTRIEIEIEDAITKNDLATARAELARLIEEAPEHPRREFLQTSIDRAEELQKLAARSQPPAPKVAARPRNTAPAQRAPSKAPQRVAARVPERSAPRSARSRTYGAPISDLPRASTMAPVSPSNTPPAAGAMQREKNFSGRTVEVSDSAVRGGSAPISNAGSAAAVPAPAAASAPKPPAAVVVTPAKVIKRVNPVVGREVPRTTSGFVVVKFDIGENGRVDNVEVVESTPPGVFDAAALTAVRKWVYEPRKENGVAVTSQAKARLLFDPDK